MRYNINKGICIMEKNMTMNLRVNPVIKQQAESVLKQLGIPMATAIDMYLRQISLTGGIPFVVALPKAPAAINAEKMTNAELRTALQEGYADMEAGNVQDASSAFSDFRASHK
jgi:DNA-damage-inducible protein J